MLKTVSSIVNALGALNYKGTWNASTNTPTLTSSSGTKGDYYVVSVAGNTTLDGISNWGVGDWVAFNGSTWQRVEGGADLNGVNLSVSGTTNLAGLTASTALALDASKNVVSVANTGTGNNVLNNSPEFTTPKITSTLGVGGATPSASGSGMTFPATQSASSDANTLDDYEEGTWTPIPSGSGGTLTAYTSSGFYTKIGRQVFYTGRFTVVTPGTVNGSLTISGLPFTAGASSTGVTREDALVGTWYFLQVLAGGSGQAQGWDIANGAINWTAGASYAFSFTTFV